MNLNFLPTIRALRSIFLIQKSFQFRVNYSYGFIFIPPLYYSSPFQIQHTLLSMSIIQKPKPQSAKQQPLPQGRGFVAKRVCARSNKRGGRAKHSFFFYLFFFFPLLSKFFQLEKTYPRKRNKPLQSNDFSSLCLSVRKKILKWYQTHLEEGF